MSYISAANIIGTNLHAPNAPKEITTQAKEGKPAEKYTRTYLSYNYGTPEKPYLSEALFELQICKGTVKRNAKGALKLNLRLKNQDDLKGLIQLNHGFALIVDKYKNRFGLRNFTPQNPGDLRGAFFYPAAEDGTIIEGSDPIVSLKMNEKTIFSFLKPKINPETKQQIINNDGTPEYETERVDYKTLENKTLDCSIIFNARDLYRSSGSPLPQLFVRSCLIFSITDNGEVTHIKSDMVKQWLSTQSPDVLNSLAEQIAKLKVTSTSTSTPSLLDSNPPKAQLPAVQAPIQNPSSAPIQLPLNQVSTSPQLNTLPPQSPAPQIVSGGGIDLTQFINSQQGGFTINKI